MRCILNPGRNAVALTLIVSDVDGTIMGPGERVEGICRAINKLYGLGYKIALATAKSIYEIIGLMDKICLRRDSLISIVESGGAIYSSPGVLLSPSKRVTIQGVELEVLELGSGLMEYDEVIDRIIMETKCADRVARLSRMDPRLVSMYTRLSLYSAKLATMREYMDVLWTVDKRCLESIAESAKALGFYVFTTKRSIHIGLHGGKHVALRALIDQIGYREIDEVIGIGDTDADKEMLEISDKAIVIPQPDGTITINLQRSDYLVAPYSAPQGWVYSIELILLKLI